MATTKSTSKAKDRGMKRPKGPMSATKAARLKKIYSDVITRPPQFTWQEVEELEQIAARWGQTRRATLALLSKPGDKLREMTDSREGAVALS